MFSGRSVSSVRSLIACAALVAVVVCGTSCATTGTPGPAASVPAQIAADCGAPVLRDEATHLVDDVASALETSTDWQAALKALGNTQYDRLKADTWPAIKCAVGEVLGRTDAQLAARSMMDEDAAKLTQRRHDRAAQWLSEHPAP